MPSSSKAASEPAVLPHRCLLRVTQPAQQLTALVADDADRIGQAGLRRRRGA